MIRELSYSCVLTQFTTFIRNGVSGHMETCKLTNSRRARTARHRARTGVVATCSSISTTTTM